MTVLLRAGFVQDVMEQLIMHVHLRSAAQHGTELQRVEAALDSLGLAVCMPSAHAINLDAIFAGPPGASWQPALHERLFASMRELVLVPAATI